ncbi:hypothetical protein [Stenotrophomonas indicatrix]|uniref:hypothetical protein n=1 Tax=Stenotrophomonas indicatrix TaxID=2045451 RepID=UPI001AA0FCDF|nr:hypothetical protein [Stenotrophomonas indicatrix]MBO1747553.1 hypothetical protein [Stenotrophomonas indicatrix]
MKMYIYCDFPSELVGNFKKKISLGNKEGGISAWSVDKDGDFTHESKQISNRIFLRATVREKTSQSAAALIFEARQYLDVTEVDKAFARKEIMGNILATFIDHFSDQFTSAAYYK